MGKTRWTALVVAVAIIGLASMRTAMGSHQSTHKAFSGGTAVKGIVVKTESQPTDVTVTGVNRQTIDSRSFTIPPDDTQLFVVDFSALTNCSGSVQVSCVIDISIGRTIGGFPFAEPAGLYNVVVGAPNAVDSRALCVRNATSSPASVGVWVVAGKASNATFLIERYTLKIARYASCSPSVDI